MSSSRNNDEERQIAKRPRRGSSSTGGAPATNTNSNENDNNQPPHDPTRNNNSHNDSRIFTGNFGSQLSQLLNAAASPSREETFLRLWGSVPRVGSYPSSLSTWYPMLQAIATFLSQHALAQQAAAATARGSTDAATTPVVSTSESSSTSASSSFIATASFYLPTLEEFAQAQSDRQAAGLRTNANRETAQGLHVLVEHHAKALQQAWSGALKSPESWWTTETLRQLHLCIDPTRQGQFRTHSVRAGQVVFGPPGRVPSEIQELLSSLQQLESELGLVTPTSTPDTTRVFYAVAMAATVLYGINDIHPFADGNGRVARIYTNALLRRYLQMPFSITLAATPQQRQEYIEGLKSSRRLLLPASDSNNTQPQPALQELMQTILERISHAVLQLQTLLGERARSHRDEEEARIARRVRERAAQGQCIICLDSNPNIATLCCGQALHLNCIAEWLANGTSCVSCRSPLPRLTVHQGASEQSRRDRNEDDDEDGNDVQVNGIQNLHDAFQQMQEAIQRAISIQNHLDGVPGETGDTTTQQQPEDTRPVCNACFSNRMALDCDNAMCGRCCRIHGGIPNHCRRHGNPAEDTTTTTTTEVSNASPPAAAANDDTTTTTTTSMSDTEPERPQCVQCRNVAASDCGNNMCGRCCQSFGAYRCARHDSRIQDDTATTTTSEPDSDTTTTDASPVNQNTVQHCRFCNNQAAVDCSNSCCGRCCVVQGLSYNCYRHGGG